MPLSPLILKVTSLFLTQGSLILTVADYIIYKGSAANYVVTANVAIVGTLHGTNVEACQYNETHRDCVPQGKYNLNQGDVVDFTFGIGLTQIVRFYYVILSQSS
jgi:hypothetical protein